MNFVKTKHKSKGTTHPIYYGVSFCALMGFASLCFIENTELKLTLAFFFLLLAPNFMYFKSK
ncbi:hypothetical protein U8V72_22125 [Priestia filamentosa]|uniref:hypothetical protein n=1 Tax=Priestia filamentosa TaxID=1402861 RepID=UPI0039794F2B